MSIREAYIVWHPVGGPMRVYDNENTAKLNCCENSKVVSMIEYSKPNLCYVCQFPDGQFVYIHHDLQLYPCDIYDAEIFPVKTDAERFAASNKLTVRTISIEVVE